MPIFILPLEVFETMSDSLNSFLNFTLSDSPLGFCLGMSILFSLLRSSSGIFYFDSKPKKTIKPKKDKITLKQMIMRFIGFDHFKEKEDK